MNLLWLEGENVPQSLRKLAADIEQGLISAADLLLIVSRAHRLTIYPQKREAQPPVLSAEELQALADLFQGEEGAA